MTSRMFAFTLASLALIAIPGPNMIFIVTRTAAQGLRAGLASALGVEVGTLLHVAVVVAPAQFGNAGTVVAPQGGGAVALDRR